jgi:hypothetical protein
LEIFLKNPPKIVIVSARKVARNHFEEPGLFLGSGGLQVARVTITGSRIFWAHGSRVQAPGFRRSSSFAVFQSRRPNMEDRVLTGLGSLGHGFQVLSPGSSLVHGLAGDRVAGVFWSRRRHPPEGRTPSPSTLPISSLSKRLSDPPDLSLNLPESLSVSHLYLIPHSLASLSLTRSLSLVENKEESRRKEKRREKRRKGEKGAFGQQ